MNYARNTKNRHNLLHLMENMEGAQFIVLDTETTGLDPAKDYIVELSLKVCRVKDGRAERVLTMDQYLHPPVKMSKKASAVNHITDEMLADKPAEEKMFPAFFKILGGRPVIIGHNVEFDIGMVKAMFERYGKVFTPLVTMDTIDFARDNLPPDVLRRYAKSLGMKPGEMNSLYRLSFLLEYYGINEGLKAHCSIDDVEGTIRLMEVLYDEYKEKQLPGTERIPYKYFYFWEGHGHAQAGIWVRLADDRLMYFSTLYKCWCSTQVDLSKIDIDFIEDRILSECGLTLAQFGRLNEKKFALLKQKKRLEGVYI